MANAYLVGIYNKVILSGDLGVHIGVYTPCPVIKRNLDPNQIDKYIRPCWVRCPLCHISPFYLYAFRMHSSSSYAFVCMVFGDKSLKLQEWYGFEVRGAHQ